MSVSVSNSPYFHDIGRDKSMELLKNINIDNCYLLRPTSLFPIEDNVFVVSITFKNIQNKKDYAHLLVLIDNDTKYKYVTDKLQPEPGSTEWSGKSFDTIEDLIQARFPLVKTGINKSNNQSKVSNYISAANMSASLKDSPYFHDISTRSDSENILKDNTNCFLLRSTSLYPNDPNVCAVSITYINDNNEKEYKHVLVKKDKGKYTYVTEMLKPDPTWQRGPLNTIEDLIKARFSRVEMGLLNPVAKAKANANAKANVNAKANANANAKAKAINNAKNAANAAVNSNFYPPQASSNKTDGITTFFKPQALGGSRRAHRKTHAKKTRKSHNSKKYTKRATKSCKVMRK